MKMTPQALLEQGVIEGIIEETTDHQATIQNIDVVLEKQSTIRKNTIDDIKKSGFDVKQKVVKLEEFYFNSVEE